MKIDFRLKEELRQYLKKKIKEEKEVVTVISAYPLTEEEINQIKDSWPAITGKKIVNVVDKKIIGGLIIKFDSQEIDLSIFNQLKNFRNLFF